MKEELIDTFKVDKENKKDIAKINVQNKKGLAKGIYVIVFLFLLVSLAFLYIYYNDNRYCIVQIDGSNKAYKLDKITGDTWWIYANKQTIVKTCSLERFLKITYFSSKR